MVIRRGRQFYALRRRIVGTRNSRVGAGNIIAFWIRYRARLNACTIDTKGRRKFAVFLQRYARHARTTRATRRFQAAHFLRCTFSSSGRDVAHIGVGANVFMTGENFVNRYLNPRTLLTMRGWGSTRFWRKGRAFTELLCAAFLRIFSPSTQQGGAYTEMGIDFQVRWSSFVAV